MDLDLDSLRCFLAATRRPSFRAAAAEVSLSPAAFSARIQGLEETLGAELFARTTRSVRLTDAGERLRPRAVACLEAAQGCADAVVGESFVPAHEFTIGTRYELGMSFLLPALDALSRAVPQRTVHLYFGDSADLMIRLQRSEVDAVVTSARLVEPNLEYVPLHEEHYVFVGARKLLQASPIRRAQDAAPHTLVDVHGDLPLFRYFQDGSPNEGHWHFAQHHYLGTIAAMRARVLSGNGVAVLPRYFVAADLKARRLVRIMPRVDLPTDWFRLVWRRDHPGGARLRSLGSQLAERPLR